MIKKYADMSLELKRQICRKHIKMDVKCDGCPFRRTRYDFAKSIERDLFCYPVLESLGMRLDDNIILEEYEIKESDLTP